MLEVHAVQEAHHGNADPCHGKRRDAGDRDDDRHDHDDDQVEPLALRRVGPHAVSYTHLTDVKLHLGYVVRKGEALSDIGQRFVDTLKKNLEKYARF